MELAQGVVLEKGPKKRPSQEGGLTGREILGLKKINVVLFPEGGTRLKQFSLPGWLLLFLILSCVTWSSVLAYIIPEFLRMRRDIPALSRLRRENQQKDRQFTRLAERINRMAEKIDELKELDQKLRIMVNLEGADEQAEPEGIGGSQPTPWRYEYNSYGSRKELVRGMHDALDDLTREIALGKQQKTSLHEFFKEQKRLLASTPSIWPVRGWLSSRFGYRTSPFTGKKEFHRGLDISARMKTPVIAPANGTVSEIRWDRWSGNVLCVNHGYGLKTVYAHLKEILVEKKQFVRRGETVALVGNTGRSTGPHLHYEVHLNKIAVDPLRYILDDSNQYQGPLAQE